MSERQAGPQGAGGGEPCLGGASERRVRVRHQPPPHTPDTPHTLDRATQSHGFRILEDMVLGVTNVTSIRGEVLGAVCGPLGSRAFVEKTLEAPGRTESIELMALSPFEETKQRASHVSPRSNACDR